MATQISEPNPNGASATPSAPPAYFLSLTVANFRCFGPEQTLDLSDGNGRPARWTVLLGENGVGKTTLLQCLAALEPFQAEYEGQYSPSVRGNVHATLSFYQGSKERRDKTTALRVFTQLYIGRLNGDTKTKKVIDWWFHVGRDNDGSFDYSEESEVASLACYGYGASRATGSTSLQNNKRSFSGYSLFDDDVKLMSPSEWLLEADYATKTATGILRKSAQARLERIRNLLTIILPEVIDFRFSTSDDSRFTPRVEAKTPYGWVRLSDLSLGYKTAIAWMIDFASALEERYPNSENPLAEPAIVLVDEIDLHLHPKWQRELVQKLTETFPQTQFIVTAHSPLIVQAAPDANLALLRREGDHVVIDNDVDEIRNWRVDQILTSDLFGLETARPPRLEPLFEERRRILSRPALTDEDRQRLTELEEQIGDAMPIGETRTDIRAMDALRRATALLERKAKQ